MWQVIKAPVSGRNTMPGSPRSSNRGLSENSSIAYLAPWEAVKPKKSVTDDER
jgi:hypothetical protein